MLAYLADLRRGLLTLVRNPGITVVLSGLLGLGTGANAAVFSLVDAYLLRALPFPNAERLVTIWEGDLGAEGSLRPLLPDHDFLLEGQVKSYESWGTYVAGEDLGFDLGSSEGSERVPGAAVSSAFFRVLAVEPALGRVFLAEEDVPGGPQVVVLAHGLWRRRFGGDPRILGRSIELSGSRWTVVGVMPPSFRYPGVELWVPRPLEVDHAMQLPLKATYRLRAVARLRGEVTLAQARQELLSLSQAAFQGQGGEGRVFRAVSLRDALLGNFRNVLLLLLGSVGVVLLIVCTNVANLSLAWLLGREREIAIRCALGADRGRLAGQLVSESLFLGLLGGAIGLLLGTWGLRLALPFLADFVLPMAEVRLNARVLLFLLAISLLSGLVAGPGIALLRSRNDPSLRLKDMAASSAPQAGRRLSSALVLAQLALAFVLLTGEGLMLQSFQALTRRPLGFEPQHVLALETIVNASRYPTRESRLAFTSELVQRFQLLPKVEAAAVSNGLPLKGGGLATPYVVQGQEQVLTRELPMTDSYSVTPSFFRALGIPLRKGRLFNGSDQAGTAPVVILDEALAQRLWPQVDPIGRRLEIQGVWREVVGVVGAIQQRGPREPAAPLVYTPLPQLSLPWPFYHVVLRVKGDPLKAVPEVRAALRQIDARQPMTGVASLEQVVAQGWSTERWVTFVLGLFALLGTILALTGVYALAAFAVARQRREIGIRIVLGAGRKEVLDLVVRQGLQLAGSGLLLGVLLGLGTTRLLRRFLFGVAPLDPWTFVFAGFALFAVVLAAVLSPAGRALRVNPADVLRAE